MRAKTRRALRLLLIVPALLLVLIGGFVAWGLTPLGPTDSALAALKSDNTVTVTHAKEGWVFTPVSRRQTRGYIFYPGGHVDARSYAPYARALARQDCLVVISEMPLSLAVLKPGAADAAIANHPEVASWSIGGHSLGGVMAAQYAARHLDTIRGLVLLASYPTASSGLADSGLRVTSLVGLQDTVVNKQAWLDAKPLLPADTRFREIVGANHGQFGDYGPQPGDTAEPDMSAAEQQRLSVSESVAVILDQAAPEN